jgi:hypothetical protein
MTSIAIGDLVFFDKFYNKKNIREEKLVVILDIKENDGYQEIDFFEVSNCQKSTYIYSKNNVLKNFKIIRKRYGHVTSQKME